MLALDVKEIHGYRPALGLSVFTEDALREVKNAESVSDITEIVEVEATGERKKPKSERSGNKGSSCYLKQSETQESSAARRK